MYIQGDASASSRRFRLKSASSQASFLEAELSRGDQVSVFPCPWYFAGNEADSIQVQFVSGSGGLLVSIGYTANAAETLPT